MNRRVVLFVVMAGVLAMLPMLSDQTMAVGPGKTLTWQGGGAGRVVFEGEEHADEGYGCKDCHPGLFSMKKGSAVMSMDAMKKGQFCGACHDGKTAFSTADESECHECHGRQERHRRHGGHDDNEMHGRHGKHHGNDD